MVHLLEVIVLAGTLIAITFMVLLSLPQCKLRDMLMPFVAWGFVALCGIYALSPIDLMPELVLGPAGIFDDFGAIAMGIGTAVATIRAQKQKTAAYIDPKLN